MINESECQYRDRSCDLANCSHPCIGLIDPFFSLTGCLQLAVSSPFFPLNAFTLMARGHHWSHGVPSYGTLPKG